MSDLEITKDNLNLVKIVNVLWNKMSIEQRTKFLENCDLDSIVDYSKLWFELDEVQQYAIVKWFNIRLFGDIFDTR